uniref:DEP domain containing 1a n=1 Tax=Hippocampus comes TaxID=109280 RepID=A0A3Q2YTA1_HIPCM
MSTHIITPGPYRATKLWNEITHLFRAGMPLKKHRQNLRNYSSCFTALAAVDWLHQMLCSNSNFGPDVTRQQTVQLLKKFLKNHVIEDVKGRWGTEDLEDNNTLYRFPSTSPLKPIPCPAVPSASKGIKKRPSLRDKEGFFRFKSLKKNEQEAEVSQPGCLPHVQRRELTEDDERNIWRDTTLTHLQKILGVASLDEVLDPRSVNPHHIIHNMTKVNKHGVVALDDKTNDLPHWVLSAMKSLANWPKYDSAEPSYPGFERDVFKTVSDYFYSLPQPLLTYELYELFINVLVYCGYLAVPAAHQGGKRKKCNPPSAPPPPKMSFRSTECLLLSLLRQGTCDEMESPMREVLGAKIQSRRRGPATADGGQLGGSDVSLSAAGWSLRRRHRSSSLETILDDSAPLTRQQIFLSNDSLASLVETSEESFKESKWRGRAASCSNVNASEDQNHSRAAAPPPSSRSRSHPSSSSSPASKARSPHATSESSGHPLASGASSLWTLSAPAVVRRCLSSLDVSKLPRPATERQICLSLRMRLGLLQPQSERVAIEALQLCTLLLPPASRRKLQLLMRMMSRISQNVDMPPLHPAIGTRTLMVHTFSSCVLGSADECDLDELLATRLVSFLMDHQQSILSVPQYLLGAINDHVQCLLCAPLPLYTFCHQISGAEFEHQKLSYSQKAMEDLLEMLVSDQNMTEKDRCKRLKQFQKQYPDIYSQRYPSTEKASKTNNKPKMKAPLLIRKTKAFSIRS